ncbi:hypothetical protein BDA96_04G267700 [Sorghum bicolor]|jgi:hypothetical protein|uniref:Uncharacterized protein n=1 Tax=Sorghum bicolor TaxID=4558 RepID=A0A921R5D5_SORBI|nr:hypothetical protein BDA96_04G267700 [Sorghum bicolor]
MMGFWLIPMETPARLLWSTSFFRHKIAAMLASSSCFL